MRNGNNNFKRIQAAGLAGILMAGLSVVGLPAEPVSAANGWDVDLNAGGNPVASSVSITMGGGTANGQLNAGSTDPNKSAGLVKRTASVEIGATDGYTVTLSGNPNLTGVNGNNKIPTVTSNTTLAQMNNQWGWYTAEGDVDCSALQTMKQMKSTGDQIAAGTLNAKTTKQFTMCFGAKVNGNQAADTYSNTVTLSVVAQPKVVQMFGGIKTMQAMTSDICKAASVNDTAYLRDTRDNKSYWVTKLADGNCWMSQNLDLDITTSNVKAADSDVTSDWNSSSSYPPVATTASFSVTNASNTTTYSWNLGNYVLSKPTSTSSCSKNDTGLSACSAQGFIDVSSWTASSDPNFYRRELYAGTDGSTCTRNADSVMNTNATGACKIYDAHYLVGNYYQWNTATAGSGGDTAVNALASGSICPKKWKLPDSYYYQDNTYNVVSDVKGSFGNLVAQYGMKGGGSSNVTSPSGLTYDIALSPLFIVRSGRIYGIGNNVTLAFAGQNGRYWSARTVWAEGHAYSFGVIGSSVSTLQYSSGIYGDEPDQSQKFYGRSVRCIMRTS